MLEIRTAGDHADATVRKKARFTRIARQDDPARTGVPGLAVLLKIKRATAHENLLCQWHPRMSFTS